VKLIIATKNKSKYLSVKSLVLDMLDNKNIDVTQIKIDKYPLKCTQILYNWVLHFKGSD
jgi:non-canonical (house-cleaning) NTP pyrophosphatase